MNTQAQNKEKFLDTLNIKEIEMGSTLDYVRFSKNTKIEATDFIKNNPKLFYETSNQKMVLKKTDEDELGFTHYRYGQTYMSIPVEDADYWIHSRDGGLTTANGNISTLDKITLPQIKITKEEAISIVQLNEKNKAAQREKDNQWDKYEAQLMWASKEKDTTGSISASHYLAYKISNQKTSYIAYLDAASGKIRYDYIATNGCQSPVNFTSYYYGTRSVTTNLQGGLYRMQDICPSVCANLNKNIQITDENDNVITNTTNSWTTDLQRKAATSQWAASNTYNYFCEKHNWKGYDNNNSLLTVKLLPTPAGQWEDGLGRMRIGNVNSDPSKPICTQDVIAHEFTHGFVIANISNPGSCTSMQGLPNTPAPSCATQSINEAVADMLGIAVEYYALAGNGNFLIAEKAVDTGIRNVSNPKSKNFPNCFKSPNNLLPTYWSSSPGTDMTYNNGAVLTFWFHLLCNGGSGTVDDKPVSLNNPAYNISSIGIDKAAKIVVRAIRYYSFNLIGFEQFRRATIESAKDLYGNCSSEVLQTAAAWRAVGLDEFFNYYVAPPTDLCNNFGGTQNSYQIYYIQNTVPLPSMACSPQNLVVKSGSTLVVTSAQSIILKPGFKAEAGCQFKAIATSCLTQTLREGNELEENFIHSENFNNSIGTWFVTPNPSQEQNLRLNYPNDRTLVKITLTDIQGKIIQENLQFEQSNQGVTFTSENLQKGVYFLHATTIEGEQKTLKLIRY